MITEIEIIVTTTDLKNTSNIKDFLLKFICIKELFQLETGISKTNEWRFVLATLSLLRVGYGFGFFKRDEHILLPRLKSILEIDLSSGMVIQHTILISF